MWPWLLGHLSGLLARQPAHRHRVSRLLEWVCTMLVLYSIHTLQPLQQSLLILLFHSDAHLVCSVQFNTCQFNSSNFFCKIFILRFRVDFENSCENYDGFIFGVCLWLYANCESSWQPMEYQLSLSSNCVTV